MKKEESILIVDDNKSLSESMSFVLGHKGYAVTTAIDGIKALKLIKIRSFDVIFMDIKMPLTDGINTCTTLKKIRPDAAVIMMTAYASLETAVEAINAGALSYIIKPLNMDEVLAIVKEVFEKKHLLEEKQRAEEALRESEERLKSFMDSATDNFSLWDSNLNLVEINKNALKLFPAGTRKKNIIGKHILDLDPNLKKTGRYNKYMEVIKTGKPFFIEDYITDAAKGKIYLALKAFKVGDGMGMITSDITKQKRAEKQIKASLEEKEILLQEVHHRVKNNMQIISSLFNLQSKQIKDKGALAIFKSSQNRVKSMALIHERLYQSGDFARVNFAEYAQILAAHLFTSYGASSEAIKLSIDIKDIFLEINTAIPCSLMINELVSNSLKHGFPDGRKGYIKITMRSLNKNNVELTVSDNGVGLPEKIDFKDTESLGLRLVTILSEDQLHGDIKLEKKKGTSFKIKFKVGK
ncbi:MAG: histidine kinase dimerization/phosphoacceptor domain -containing protein [Candidatus Aminicenantaceae bacterium]